MSYHITPYAQETLTSHPTPAYQAFSTLTTGHPYLQIRDDATTTSKSSSRTSSATTSSCTDKQRCQTGTSTTPLTIGLSIGLPVFVFALIIGVFAIRNYRKGKKEAEHDNDPDFYGETTILPDYPIHPDNSFARNNSQYDLSYPPNATGHDNTSFYSNPFQGESNRYPSTVIHTRGAPNQYTQYDNASYSPSLNHQDETRYGSFTLPYQHNLGSKQSLDALAKQIGSEYAAYPLSTPTSRPNSREGSRHTSRQPSPQRGFDNQSVNGSNLGGKKANYGDVGSTLKNASTNDDEAEEKQRYSELSKAHADDSEFQEKTEQTVNTADHGDDDDSFTVESTDGADIFEDSYAEPRYSQVNLLQPEEQNTHKRNVSEFSYVADHPEVLQREEDQQPVKSLLKNNTNVVQQQEKFSPQEEKFLFEDSQAASKPQGTVEVLNDNEVSQRKSVVPGEEDDENVKRMKSVYRIYFDRENSVRSKRTTFGGLADGEEAPPLPQIDTNFVQAEQTHNQQPEEPVDHEQHLAPEIQEHHETSEVDESNIDEPPVAESSYLNVEPSSKGKSHRVVSSIYSTIPLAKFDENGQSHQQYQQQYPPQQQSYPNHQDQQYHPDQQQQQQYQQYDHQQQQPQQQQQYNQYYDPQYAAGQNQPAYQQHPPQSSQLNQQPYFVQQPAKPLEPIQALPTPNKIGYDSVINNQAYAPKKSLTSAARPQIEIKPFNPLHYSDKIFSPTSPITPSSPSFSNSGSQFDFQQQQQPAAPSPHHIRQSIVMVDPVEIGAAKLYRPAGSFTRELHSANSSRSGSLSSQSGFRGAFYNPDGSRNEVLPRAGSQSDLRKQLGSSENYNF